MTLSWHYRDDIEWPLNGDGLAKLQAEDVEHDPTIYDPAVHLIDPATVAMPATDEALWYELADAMGRSAEARTNPSRSLHPNLRPGKIAQAFGVTTPVELALAVRADGPLLHTGHAMQWCLDSGAKPRAGLFPTVGSVDFANGPLACGRVLGSLPHAISPHAFAVKWYHGMIRPAQLLDAWFADRDIAPLWFSAFADDCIAQLAKSLRTAITSADDFAIFREPPHPSRIAMHAALAKMVKGLRVTLDLDERDDLVADLDEFERDITHGRDTGFVHYWDDGAEGLRVADAALASILPRLVADIGGDGDQVSEILEGLS